MNFLEVAGYIVVTSLLISFVLNSIDLEKVSKGD